MGYFSNEGTLLRSPVNQEFPDAHTWNKVRQDRKPLIAATVKKLPLLYAPHEEPGGFTARKKA